MEWRKLNRFIKLAILINYFMDIDNDSTTQTVNPFLQKHSAAIRIWHWINFFLITLTITIVIINLTLLNPRNNAGQVRGQLQEQGITINERQAFFVAHHFDDQLWDLHKWIGIGISVMLLMRILLEFMIPAEERFRFRISSAIRFSKEGNSQKADYNHYLIVKWSYVLFYILLICMSLTGLTLAFEHQMEFLGNLRRPIHEIHELGQWAMYLFVIFHVGGIVVAELQRAKGVVSGMIHGN